MSSEMEIFCNFCRSYSYIEWRKTSIIICAIPFSLLFVLMHALIFIFDYEVGSIVSNAEKCAEVGKGIMNDGGSVVDVAIAVLVCESVFIPHRVGIGGGFSAIMYVNGKFDTIIATPTVPANYLNGAYDGNRTEDFLLAGVPGELKGYWEMHQKYGMLPWARLFQPTIKICKNGFTISEWKENYLEKLDHDVYRTRMMSRLYETLLNETDKDRFRFEKLSSTLQIVADQGIDAFYNGEIGQALIEDLKKDGGVMSIDDLMDYNVSWSSKAVKFWLPHNLMGYTTPLPSSGALVALIMNIVKSLPDKNSPVFWHKVIEAMKHAYGHSFSLGDMNHETNKRLRRIIKTTYKKMISMNYAASVRDLIDESTVLQNISSYGVKFSSTYQGSSSNICIISVRGNAIVLSSSLFTKSSSFFYSNSTGIFLNNQIQSFEPKNNETLPNSPNSFTRPGKRPFTGHCPTIIMKSPTAEIFFVVGASGDEGAVSQVITALIQYCLIKKDVRKAVNNRFFFPDVINGVILLSTKTVDRLDEVLNYLFRVGNFLMPFLKSNPYAFRTCISHSHLSPTPMSSKNIDSRIALIKSDHDFNSFLLIIIISLSLTTIVIMAYEIVKFSKFNINLT